MRVGALSFLRVRLVTPQMVERRQGGVRRITKREVAHISAKAPIGSEPAVRGRCAACRWGNSLAVSSWIDFSASFVLCSQKNSVIKVTGGR
jgi:hypothetical protein